MVPGRHVVSTSTTYRGRCRAYLHLPYGDGHGDGDLQKEGSPPNVPTNFTSGTEDRSDGMQGRVNEEGT